MSRPSLKWTYVFLCFSFSFLPVLLFQNCSQKQLEISTPSTYEELNPPNNQPQISPLPKIFAGTLHSCSVQYGGLKCWGYNGEGNLGNGNTINQNAPVQVSGMLSGVVGVSLGHHNTCAVKDSGALYCWGINNNGQFGTGSTTPANASSPQSIPTMESGVTKVSVGNFTVCAIKSGALYCWGRNDYGQVGVGNTTMQTRPVLVTGMDRDVIDVDVAQYGGVHVCALKTGGRMFCWGYNANGELGDGTTLNRALPVQVSGMESDVMAISSGGGFTCALKRSQLYCWGYHQDGRLGIGPYDGQNRAAPTKVPAFEGKIVTRVDAGGYHACAVVDGSMYCWGRNDWANIGNGTTANQFSPVKITGMDNVTDVAAGGTFDGGGARAWTFALIGNALYGWGRNDYGQLGNGTNTNSSAPTVPAFSFP